jgi:hypothetical protein
MLGAMQLCVPQLQRNVREQQCPGDLRSDRMHDAVSKADRRRQRELQRHGMRSSLPDQRTPALRGRVHRTDCRLYREVPGRTKILRVQRHVHSNEFLLHIERLQRHQYHAVLLGWAMRSMHEQYTVYRR